MAVSTRSSTTAVGIRSPKAMAVREVQQEFAGLCGIEGRAVWDLQTEDEKDDKKTFAGYAHPFPGIRNLRHMANYRENIVLRKSADKHEANNGKYYGGNLLMSILYVLRTEEKKIQDDALFDTKFSCHPLIRIRKCINNEASIDCCMIFVDESGRVYQNWNDYKENNHLPEGTLVAPYRGVYRNSNGNVMLECFISPASTTARKVLETTDKSASVLGLVATVAPIASMFTPVGPIVLGASILTGAIVGAYSAGRSAYNLVDRGQHEQSINVTDREARSSWLGIGAGVTCLAASGATSALARSSAAGRNVSKVAMGAVNTLNVTSTMINGVTIANGAFEMILKKRDGEEITWADCLQMSASLFLFTHSIYNFQTASKIVQTSRDNTIKSVRDGLSKRQRFVKIGII